jgi:hypothetical protein
MKKFSKKGAVVFGAALAICAFVTPAMASAANWAVVGSEHTLTATNLGFTTHVAGGNQFGWQCGDWQFTADVRSAAVVTITTATFTNCTGTGLGSGCTDTMKGTNFPWTATGITTSNIQIHGIDIDMFFEGSCTAANQAARLTGTLSGARWLGNGVGQHSITVTNATGLVLHSAAFGSTVVTVNDALVIDRQQTLTLS